MIDLRGKYKDKKVFITGITGFKGSWLALILHELGAKVYGIGLEQEDPRAIYHKAKIENIATVYIGDIRQLNKDEVSTAYRRMTECDYVFHLAAQPLVSVGYTRRIETMDVNVMGTMLIQEMIKDTNHKMVFVNVTTDKVYKPSDEPHKETDLLQGIDPYSLSKSFSDLVTQMYRNFFFNNNVTAYTVRAGNVIGGGDYCKDRIVVDLIESLESNKSLHLRQPNSVRPYQYVLDCLMQYLIVAAYGTHSEYNIGPDKNTLVKTIDLVKSFKKLDNNIKYDFKGDSIGQETATLSLNTDRVKNEFNIHPFCNNIDDITRETYNWYNKNINNEELDEFSLKQVKEVINFYENQ